MHDHLSSAASPSPGDGRTRFVRPLPGIYACSACFPRSESCRTWKSRWIIKASRQGNMCAGMGRTNWKSHSQRPSAWCCVNRELRSHIMLVFHIFEFNPKKIGSNRRRCLAIPLQKLLSAARRRWPRTVKPSFPQVAHYHQIQKPDTLVVKQDLSHRLA